MNSKARIAAIAPLFSLALVLGGCGGGGGVSSTPTPPATGGGGNGGGNGGGGTPTPTPSGPPPMGVNDDLLSPLQSETFANDAVTGSVSYPTNGNNGTTSAQRGNVTFYYDAASNSYTVRASGREQTFRPADRDAAASLPQLSIYTRTSGTTTDSLILTTAAQTGPFTYRYVGAGVWQRTIQGSTTISGTLDAFTYGVDTPDSAVPRTGNAAFDISMIGIIAYTDQPTSLSGEGTLLARFGDGSLEFSGQYDEFLAGSGAYLTSGFFQGTGAISASANDITGTIDISGLSGGLDGRFYGPAAEEIGLAWFANSTFGVNAAGTIAGRRSGGGTSSGGLTAPATYDLSSANLVQGDTFLGNEAGEPIGTAPSGFPDVSEFEVAGSNFAYRIFGDSSAPRTVTFADSMRDAAASTGLFDVFRRTASGSTDILEVFKPGAANAEIELTYAGFGHWTTLFPASGGERSVATRFFLYGDRTPGGFIPATGTASYTGRAYGQGIGQIAGNGGASEYDLTGTFAFDVNFAGGGLSGTMDARLDNVDGSGGFAISTLSMSANFPGETVIGQIGNNGEFLGGFGGSFFGDNLEEFGAVFQFGGANPANNLENIYVQGAMVGTQD